MNKLYLGDNLGNLKQIPNNSIGICYIDPPYNTGNKFNYDDNISKSKWNEEIIKRIKEVKKKLVRNGVVLFSISEESLFDAYNILKQNFNYVFEPLIWQTKSILNQNKVSNISSIIHEYILVASDKKIKTNLEEIKDRKIVKEKIKNYPLLINLNNKYIELLEKNINNKEKKIIEIKDFNIIKHNNDLKLIKKSFSGHLYQKRTIQKGHGSERYIKTIKEKLGDNYNKNSLYFISPVKDKQNLGGKFILGNSYFQSINISNLKLKMPSFLGFYQPGKSGFQTAKPIELMERLFKNFNIFGDLPILDLYSGSGNVLKAINNLGLDFIGFEYDKDNGKTLNILKCNLKDIKYELGVNKEMYIKNY